MKVSRRSMVAAVALMPLSACARATPAPRPHRTVGGITRLHPALDRIVDARSPVEVLGTGYEWTEGPAWSRAGGYLVFSDVPGNVAHRWTAGGGASPWLDPSGLGGPVPQTIREAGSNGLAFARDGALLIANSGGRSVDRLDVATGARSVLADRFEGRRLNSPNDLVETRGGAIYFTDPPYGLAAGDDSALKEQPHNGVYRLEPGAAPVLVDGSLSRPNGIALSPDERTLYVAISEDAFPRILAYALDDAGNASAPRLWADFRGLDGDGSADGLKTDVSGNVYATGPGGVHVLAQDGTRLGLIATGKPVANVGWGEDGHSLFLTSSDMLARVRLRASGW